MSRQTFELKTLLNVANVAVVLLALLIYGAGQSANQYVNSYTLALLIVVGMQNHLMLSLRGTEPFVILLVANTIAFYMFRVASLSLDPWSVALSRYALDAGAVNHALGFVILANLAIFLGLCACRREGSIPREDESLSTLGKTTLVAVLLGVSVYINFFDVSEGGWGTTSVGYLRRVFLNTSVLMLLGLTYAAVHGGKLQRRFRVAILGLVGVAVAFATIMGSRSALLYMGIFVLISFLSTRETVRISTTATIIVASLAVASVIIYPAVTYVRQVPIDRTQVSVEQVATIAARGVTLPSRENLRVTLRPVLDRMGYLDYAADMIANRDRYAAIVNFSYYGKSVVDNVLTPGFNVYEAPKVANSLAAIYRNAPEWTHADVAAVYQSDMLTAYGEAYVLLGPYAALLLLFLLAYSFKRVYAGVWSRDRFSIFAYRSLILLIYYYWLNSFGFDWTAMDLVSVGFAVLLVRWIYAARRRGWLPSSLQGATP